MSNLLTTASQFKVGGNGMINPCCMEPKNRGIEVQTSKRGLFVQLCRVCERRHFRMIAEPGRLGVVPGG